MAEKQEEQNVVEATVPAQQQSQSTAVNTLDKRQINSSLSTLDLMNPNDIAAAEIFLKRMMKSEKGGIKSVEEGFAIMLRAQDLNLPFTTCIEHIHVINGKTGIDIHVIKALLLRAGCTWEHTKDYQPLYEYMDGINVYNEHLLPDYTKKCKSAVEAKKLQDEDKDGEHVYVYPVKWFSDFNGNCYKEYQLSNTTHVVVTSRAEAMTAAKEKKIGVYRIPAKPIDYVEEYKLTRVINNTTMTSIGRFSHSEAIAADMFGKDTYKKYPRILIGHRAFTYAARDIASDVLFGACETSELKIIANVPLSDRDGFEEVEIVDISK